MTRTSAARPVPHPLLRQRQRAGDRLFASAALAAGLAVLGILAAIAAFLVLQALPSLRSDTTNFLTTKTFTPDAAKPSFGIAALAYGTVVSSVLAVLIAAPVAIGTAVFTTEYAPRRIATALGHAADLLVAVPSVVYGLWGLFFLVPHLVGVQRFLSTYLGWIPLFSTPPGLPAQKSIVAASVVLALMVIPVVGAISREVLRQVDPAVKEAALALGATRWEVIRTAVLPPSRPGIVSAVMLGLGRALGETIAIALVLGTFFGTSAHLLLAGQHNTIAANIATMFGESAANGRSALIASGLVLFAITLVVNLAARTVIARAGA